MKKLQIISLGCSKTGLTRAFDETTCRISYTLVPENADLSEEPVDYILINTCGFIQDAKEESIETIFKAIEAKTGV